MADPTPEQPKPKWRVWLTFGLMTAAALGFGWFAAENETAGAVLNTVVRWSNWLYLGLALLSLLVWLVGKIGGRSSGS